MPLLKIAITQPYFFDGEREEILRLLDNGFDFVNIRKPGATFEEVRTLISSIPSDYHSRLRIHDHFAIADDFSLGGVHLNSRNPVPPQGCRNISRSCHSLEELGSGVPEGCRLEFQTLSPIFDSISKPGYTGRFNLKEISSGVRGMRVVALGGVTPERLSLIEEAGFYGAAMLGAAWQNHEAP